MLLLNLPGVILVNESDLNDNYYLQKSSRFTQGLVPLTKLYAQMPPNHLRR